MVGAMLHTAGSAYLAGSACLAIAGSAFLVIAGLAYLAMLVWHTSQ